MGNEENSEKPSNPKPKTIQVGSRTYKETSIMVAVMNSKEAEKS